jgi:Leucine-rich repeat (LRR) protein
MQLDNRALKHIPLLEGEEKIKFLHLQNNEISKIENLVSLPNLHFLDLSSNKLSEINNFSSVVHLRVLILSKNMISSIPKSNLDTFRQLDVLDLHDNRITGKVDFSQHFKKLQNLRILNLSGNQIEEIEMTCSMKSLVELNLRGNKIKALKIGLGVKGLKEVQYDCLAKVYLSNNQIKDFDHV